MPQPMHIWAALIGLNGLLERKGGVGKRGCRGDEKENVKFLSSGPLPAYFFPAGPLPPKQPKGFCQMWFRSCHPELLTTDLPIVPNARQNQQLHYSCPGLPSSLSLCYVPASPVTLVPIPTKQILQASSLLSKQNCNPYFRTFALAVRPSRMFFLDCPSISSSRLNALINTLQVVYNYGR